jgi:hypothetical protein
MTTATIIQEIIGFAGSGLVLVGFTLSGERRIRLVGILACIFFLVYAIMITSPSMIATNVLLVFVHLYKINKMNQSEKRTYAKLGRDE